MAEGRDFAMVVGFMVMKKLKTFFHASGIDDRKGSLILHNKIVFNMRTSIYKPLQFGSFSCVICRPLQLFIKKCQQCFHAGISRSCWSTAVKLLQEISSKRPRLCTFFSFLRTYFKPDFVAHSV